MLSSVIGNCGIQIVLEEWDDSQGVSIASTLKSDKLGWENVGTQGIAEYDTRKSGYINFVVGAPQHTRFPEYIFDIHERREIFMVKQVEKFMAPWDRGAFVVGMNHLHSIMSKLRAAGFEVRGGNWLRIGVRGGTNAK